MSQIIFIVTVVIAFGLLGYSFSKVIKVMKQLKPFKIQQIGKRFMKMFDVAIAQTKILKRPVIGLMHALVFWGFIVILFGSLEMMIDGFVGTERILGVLGFVYDVISGGGDIFALIIAIFIFVFILRRTIFHVKRFEGVEMKKKMHTDALVALSMIFVLMITLLGMNAFYLTWAQKAGDAIIGVYPIGKIISPMFSDITLEQAHFWYKFNWWTHILLIFVFANILPYSKHFHVFMSVPNVFLSRLQPLGKMDTMESITNDVKSMLNPETAYSQTEAPAEIARFGALDCQDFTWKTYMDSLSCTQCGRCTSVCPANKTGKLLSPRKLLVDLRMRMKEKTPYILKGEKTFEDGKFLLNDYITEEELWACTTCNACAFECPISMNHPTIIFEMRRYLVMEKSAAPAGLITAFQNIENNGAPWQFNALDRLLWADNIESNGQKINIPIMANLIAESKEPEFLLWVGSAGAFDDRYKKVMQHFVKILNHLNVNYAVLGTEESDSGDLARRAGNEMLFQMQAITNVELLKAYNVKKIITCDPHDFNTLKHEYSDFGAEFEVIHHTEFIDNMIKNKKLKLNSDLFKGKKVTFHDPCYLGRINGIVCQPRNIIKALNSEVVEMERYGKNSFCCGAGGGQMFKEAEKGTKEIFIERTEEAIKTNADFIVTACPFCMTMMTDGIKYKNQEEKLKNFDIAELVSLDLKL